MGITGSSDGGSPMRPVSRGSRPSKRGAVLRILGTVTALGAAVAAVAIAAFLPKRENPAPEPVAPAVNVRIEEVRVEPELVDDLELSGIVEPVRVVRLAAEVDSRVERIFRQEGDHCSKGELLFELNKDLLSAEEQRIEAELKYNLDQYRRAESLSREGSLTQRELEEAARKLAVSRAGLSSVRFRLDRTEIRSPIAGALNRVLVEVGEYVRAGTLVAQIVEVDRVKVAVDVSGKDIHYFTPGAEALVLNPIEGSEGPSTGVITYISELADERTRTTPIEITVDNPSSRLKSGQIVSVRLTRRVLRDVIMVPLQAVIAMEDAKAVYVVAKEGAGRPAGSLRAERREVELGIMRGRRVQIRSGLAGGDKLIVGGHRFVAPGQKVRVTPGD